MLVTKNVQYLFAASLLAVLGLAGCAGGVEGARAREVALPTEPDSLVTAYPRDVATFPASGVDAVERRQGGLRVTFFDSPNNVLREARAARVGGVTEISVRVSKASPELDLDNTDISLAYLVDIPGDPGPPYVDAATGRSVNVR